MKISLDERQKLMLLAALTVLALLLVAVYRHHEKRQSAPDVPAPSEAFYKQLSDRYEADSLRKVMRSPAPGEKAKKEKSSKKDKSSAGKKTAKKKNPKKEKPATAPTPTRSPLDERL